MVLHRETFFIVMSQKWLATPLHNTIGCSSQPKTKAYLAGVGGDRDDVTTMPGPRSTRCTPLTWGAGITIDFIKEMFVFI